MGCQVRGRVWTWFQRACLIATKAGLSESKRHNETFKQRCKQTAIRLIEKAVMRTAGSKVMCAFSGGGDR